MTTYIPIKIRAQIEQEARHRCGYCLSDETLTGIPLSIEHILPEALGGETIHTNLWLACRPCNEYKGTQTHAEDQETGQVVPLFNPREHQWNEHFYWSQDGCYILGSLLDAQRLYSTYHLNIPQKWVIISHLKFI